MPEVALSPLEPTETVTVRADETALLAVAVTVTVVADASSFTLDGATVRVTTESSSASVSVVPVTVECALVPATPMVSSPSTVVSSVGVSVNVPVPVVAFAASEIVKSVTAA